jgi:hypothetical protein
MVATTGGLNVTSLCSRCRKIVRASVLVLSFTLSIACGGRSSPDVIWDISVEPNRANATSGSSPDNEVDFSVMADYTSARSAPWNGDVQWLVDAGWVNLQKGRAICTGPAPPLFPLNIPTPAGITARITTSEGKTLTAPALLACF